MGVRTYAAAMCELGNADKREVGRGANNRVENSHLSFRWGRSSTRDPRPKPDLVILDCNMPELSGLLVLRQMRDSLKLHDTPVLALTGRSSRQDEEIAFYEGADDFMRKPFEPEELVLRVEDLLAKKR